MIEHPQGIHKEVAEIKFLIHDLRVESFINEVIHFHVTVNTDLEIYNVDQAQAIHAEDLQELKSRAVGQRRAFQDYCNAVKSLSPEKAILAAGTNYVKTIYDLCEMILNPRWGRIDQVLSFLPHEARSARSQSHYMNCIRWICGVQSRIRHFMDEKDNKDLNEDFDIAAELQYFVRNVVYGYVTEKSSARVEIRLDRLDPAVLSGNRFRFRRMVFNLVMNAVDAMSQRKVGVLDITDRIEGERVVLRVHDNGSGMPPEKIEQLLTDTTSLEGEIHSLGFVFVRQTIADFGGVLSVDSVVDKGSTISISLPHFPGRTPAPPPTSECEQLTLLRSAQEARARERTAHAKKLDEASHGKHDSCGELIYADYMVSEAQFPGSIFAMGVSEEDRIDFFTHKPYERDWNITHEDLSPMFFEATVRGRLEEEEDKTPVLILKAPQNVREYFEFRSVEDAERTPERYVAMVHDEYVRIARKLIDTGMSPETGVRLTDLQNFFPEGGTLHDAEPFPLETLAGQPLTSERGA
jgi:hypothetical protein